MNEFVQLARQHELARERGTFQIPFLIRKFRR
jgi:hypothetical protein